MEDSKKLAELTKQAEEESTKLEQMRKELKADPEYVKLEQEEANIEAQEQVLRKKKERIEKRIRVKYLTDEAYGPWYDPKGNIYHKTNIQPHFIEAIKQVVGTISKLRGRDVEAIISNLMDRETDEATAKVRAEQQKLSAKAKELYNRGQAMEHAKLSEQSKKAGELLHTATELKQKLSPQGALEEFRKNAVAPETLAKICQRAQEILKQQSHS